MGGVTMIKSGGQVNYRLGGGHDLSDAQVEYRLGEQNDAREVFWIGDGATAEACGVTAGERVEGADRARVHALMDGVNPATGEVMVVPKLAVAESAKVAAVPGHDAIVRAAAERGCEPVDLFTAKAHRSAWTTLARQVEKRGDVYRTPAATLDKLGRAAGVDVGRVYDRDSWAEALENAHERVQVGTKGFDVGLTLPKGASLALINAPEAQREQMKAIANRCAMETFHELAERVAYGSTGHQGDGQIADRIGGSGIVGTMTMEATSRAGDGHIHYHSMIANMTICADGKARTIGAGGYDVAVHGPWASELFRMKYRTETERAGLAEWGFNEKTGEYDDLSISDEAKSLASKRHNAIAIEKAAFGPDGGRSVDAMAERITRDGKAESVETLDEVSARFGDELAANGIELHGANGLATQDAANSWDAAQWQEHLDATLTEHNAVFTRVQAEAAIIRRIGHGDVERVNAIADRYLGEGRGTLDAVPTMLSQRLNDGQRYTTEAILEAEKTVYETTAQGLGQANHTIDREQALLALSVYEAAEGFELNDGQREMFLRWTTGGNQVDLTIGPAGTGKTAAADAARFAWESQDLRVLGISTSGLAAQNLGAAANVEVWTAAALVKAIEEGRAPDVDVILWDEMGMASTREQAVILPWAAATRADLRGAGDPKQLDSVGTGSTFGPQCEQVNATALTENMRQKREHERAAVEHLRSGDAGAAFAIYAEHGQIVVCKTEDERVQAMAAAWAEDAALVEDPHERLTHSVMISGTNSNVEKLHLAAREEARARGWVSGEGTVYYGPAGPKSWFNGDAVLVRKSLYSNRRDPQASIYNGQRGIVTGIDPETRVMSVEWKDASGQLQARTLDPGYVAEHVAPGTAITGHGAQGGTFYRVHTDNSGVGLNGAYVPGSRDTDKVTFYSDLNSLDVHGKERVAVLRMSEQERADWAGRQMAQRIEAGGWQIGETAHEATRTAVPMGERGEPGRDVAASKPPTGSQGESAAERYEELLSTASARGVWNRDSEPGPVDAGDQVDWSLAETPREQRPHWARSATEIQAELAALEALGSDVENVDRDQQLLNARRERLDQLRHEHQDAAQEVQDARAVAEQIRQVDGEWKSDARAQAQRDAATVREHEQAVEAARSRRERKAASVALEHHQGEMAQRYPSAGVPDGSVEWAARAEQDALRVRNERAEQLRADMREADRAGNEQLAKRQREVEQIEGVDPSDEVSNSKRRYGHVEQSERWQSHENVARDADSMASDLEARHRQTDKSLTYAQQELDREQDRIDQARTRGPEIGAQQQELRHELAIRDAQPPMAQEYEQSSREQRQQLAQASQRTERQNTHEHAEATRKKLELERDEDGLSWS